MRPHIPLLVGAILGAITVAGVHKTSPYEQTLMDTSKTMIIVEKNPSLATLLFGGNDNKNYMILLKDKHAVCIFPDFQGNPDIGNPIGIEYKISYATNGDSPQNIKKEIADECWMRYDVLIGFKSYFSSN